MATMTIEGMIGAADGVTQSFLTQTYPALAGAISTPIYLVAVLYWAVYGYKIYGGYEPMRWSALLSKAFMTAAVFSALNWGSLGQSIYGFFTSFMEGVASTIMSGQSTASMLDALYNNVGQVSALMQNVSWYQFGMILQGFGLFLINCVLFVLALVYMTIAKFGLAITMVLLPVFAAFFFFEQTRQWAINWLSKMLNFCFIYILVIAIVRFGFLAFGDAIDEAGKASSVTDAAFINVQQVAYLYIVEGVLIIFMLQVKGWAAALAGGASVQGLSLLMMAARTVTRGPIK
ncbi:type IV secretion system protein [Caballeronia sp. LZ008]|uniref:type IV secretion system protein n=1 Tax=Caballeronia sp. LZ008 TaxID=3038560 RepID=UPI00285AB3CB|nr:type IV secretion system protein [Caballeronia sp. LZ008]MDR5797986.1 type IV secretion system protein [Caballeronia sp. LZ008]